jgi:hypothetical protein
MAAEHHHRLPKLANALPRWDRTGGNLVSSRYTHSSRLSIVDMRMLTLLAVTYTANNTSSTAAGHSFPALSAGGGAVDHCQSLQHFSALMLGFLPL